MQYPDVDLLLVIDPAQSAVVKVEIALFVVLWNSNP